MGRLHVFFRISYTVVIAARLQIKFGQFEIGNSRQRAQFPIKAVSTFDYSKGNRFATYASRCIENEILMHFRAKKKSSSDIYIDEPIETDKDGNQLTLSDIIGDDEDIIEKIDLSIRSGQLYKFLEQCLDSREMEVIKLRYGLYGCYPLTQREVSDKLNISRSYVSRIEKKALTTLKNMYDKNPY